MADRTHSKVENSRYGRYLAIEIVHKIINTFKTQFADELSDNSIVKVELDQISYEIFKSYFKWHNFTITDNTNVKHNLKIWNDTAFVYLETKSHQSKIPINTNIQDQILGNYKEYINHFLKLSGYHGVDCQSSDSFTDKLNAILVMRESHLHHSEFYKDCIITSNQADIETIRALDQTHTVSLPVNCEHNKLDIDGIKDHCEQSAEFIAGIIIPEDVVVTKEIIKYVHSTDGYVYKQCSYNELLNSKKFNDIGVDIIGFGPIATTEELSVYLPSSYDTGTSLSYGKIYTTPANSIGVEILKTLVSNV